MRGTVRVHVEEQSAPQAPAVALTATDAWTPLTVLRRWARASERTIDALVDDRWWSVRVAALAAALGALLAAPPFGGFGSSATPLWRFTLANSGPQLFDPHVDVHDQPGNLTFRVVPRLFGAVLHLDRSWEFYLLQLAFGLVFLWAACEVFERALGSRRSAAVLTIATASTWAGATGWLETRGLFDAFGLAFLALAMRARRWPAVLVLSLTATFCDERALLALPLVVCWHAWRPRTDDRPTAARSWDQARGRRADLAALVDPRCGAVVVAVALHLVIRTWLKHRYGVPEGQNRYPQDPLTQLRNYPNGLWSAFEGLWLIVACGLWAWLRAGRRVACALAALAGAGSLLVGMSVVDVTRAVAFAWPLVPVAALGLAELPAAFVRRLVWVAAAVCLVSPMVYAAGDQTVDWFYPAVLVVPKAVAGWLM